MRFMLLLTLLLSGCSAGGCTLHNGQHVDTTTCMIEQ
jgi:hypothetical protein